MRTGPLQPGGPSQFCRATASLRAGPADSIGGGRSGSGSGLVLMARVAPLLGGAGAVGGEQVGMLDSAMS